MGGSAERWPAGAGLGHPCQATSSPARRGLGSQEALEISCLEEAGDQVIMEEGLTFCIYLSAVRGVLWGESAQKHHSVPSERQASDDLNKPTVLIITTRDPPGQRNTHNQILGTERKTVK